MRPTPGGRPRTTATAALATVAALSLAACGRPGHAAAAGPLVITHGGTYSGPWASDDPGVPAVTVRTADPVVIEHADLRGRGALIAVVAPHADVTVRDVRGTGENPGVAGRPPGRFLTAEGFDRVTVEHCQLAHTAGIYLLDWSGRGDRPVRVVANRAADIDGRLSDGGGGWLAFNDRKSRRDGHVEHGYAAVQFLQLDKVRHAAGMEVGWNEVVNEPGRSRVEDNVNVYDSGGTAAAPLLVHDNYVQGAYTIDPARRDGQDADWAYGWGYSGGGLLLGDGPAATADTAAAFVRATGNVVVGTVNYGIAVAAGHDVTFDGNTIVSAGTLPDGRRIPAQNVGAYVWDGGRGKARGSFFGNGGRDNTIGWASAAGGRNDSWTPDAAAWTGTAHLTGTVTGADEARARADWVERARRAGVTVGLTGGR